MAESTAITLSTALANAGTAVTTVMGVITGNELLFTLFAGSLVFMGASIVGKIKRTSKH